MRCSKWASLAVKTTRKYLPMEGCLGAILGALELALEEFQTASRARQLVTMLRTARIRELVLLLYLPIGILSKVSSDEGSSCTSSQGWEGLCMLSYECTGLGELVVKGYTPELCNTAGPVVCCPEGPTDDFPVATARPGTGGMSSTTHRPVNISPSPTPYVAEESNPRIRKVSLPSMRIRRRRPAVKRHAHILVKTYNDDDEVNTIHIRARPPLKPSRRRKRRPVHPHRPKTSKRPHFPPEMNQFQPEKNQYQPEKNHFQSDRYPDGFSDQGGFQDGGDFFDGGFSEQGGYPEQTHYSEQGYLPAQDFLPEKNSYIPEKSSYLPERNRYKPERFRDTHDPWNQRFQEQYNFADQYNVPQASLATSIAEAKLEVEEEARLLLQAEMSGTHSVTVHPPSSHTAATTTPSSQEATDPSPSPKVVTVSPKSSHAVTRHPTRGISSAVTIRTLKASSVTRDERLAKIMCDAYSEAMTETVAELSKKGVVPKKAEKCTLSSMMSNTKTTGALVGEFPHVVGLGYTDQNLRTSWGKCSGALISENYVLTAAHCTHAPTGRPLSIGMGSRTLSSESEIGISDVIVHPHYNKTTYANNLALLKLAKKTRLSDTLRPACLQTSHMTPRSLISSHWSNLPPVTLEIKTRSNESRLFSNPDVMGLQKERMSLLKNKDCDINSELTDSFICAQSTVTRRNGDENCQGYGGDALQYRNSANKCMYTLIGIAVENVCDDSPIAYTKVSHYLSWIEGIVWA